MSGYLGKIVTAVSAALEFNSATLSGAIDIIVIEDDTGKRQCSPFYIRFGKLQLLKSRGMPVDIQLNDSNTDLRMYLGAAGEAYFYDPSLADKLVTTSGETPFLSAGTAVTEEIAEKDGESDTVLDDVQVPSSYGVDADPSSSAELPSPIIPSAHTTAKNVDAADAPAKENALRSTRSLPLPIPVHSEDEFYTRAIRSTSDLGFQNFGYMSDSEMELTRGERDGTTEVVDEPRSPPVSDPQRRWTSQWARGRSALQKQTIASSISDVEMQLPGADVPPKPSNTAEEDTASPSKVPLSSVTPVPSEDQLSSLFGLPGPGESTDDTPNETPERPASNSSETGVTGGNQRGEAEGDNRGENFDDSAKRRTACENDTASRNYNDASPVHAEEMPFNNPSDVITLPVGQADVERDEDSKLELRSLDGFEESTEFLHPGIEDKLVEALQKSSDRGPGSSQETEAVDADDSQWTDDESDAEGVIEMSLCGKALREGMEEDDMMAVFEEHRVTHPQFVEDPNILYNKSLLFRIEDRLVDFRVAAPFVMAMLAFKTPMDIDKLSKMLAKPVEEEPPKPATSPPRRFGWFGWSSQAVEGEPLLAKEDLDAIATENAEKSLAIEEIPTVPASDVLSPACEEPVPTIDSEALVLPPAVEDSSTISVQAEEKDQTLNAAESSSVSKAESGDAEGIANEALEESVPGSGISREEAVFAEADYESECFSFKPSPEQLGKLDLKPGANEIRFVVASRSVELRCRVFLWSNDSKIVISDVDGTITRSDVLGHLLPAVGRDWSQVGVAGLYSQIAKNGYKMLYLTARPIGQASQTRDFLHSVTQGTARLPNGPVLMSPNRLVESFTREVIRRKPHEFKIACLRDVRSLFPPAYNPFHAGFGNRDTDVISYRAVGLIPQRIFVVNPKGELVVMKAMYESTASYSNLQVLVENVFPDINGKSGQEWIRQVTETATYNDWNYWRGSLPIVDFDALLSGGTT